MHELTSIPGVEGVAAVHMDPSTDPLGPPRLLVSCADVAQTPALGHCPAGVATVTIDLDFGGAVIDQSTPMSDITWPAADVSTAQLSTMLINTIVVSTDGSPAAVERTRTVLERQYPETLAYAPETVAEVKTRGSRELDDYRRLANVVLLASLPIAGCSLAVSVAGGLAERRRPFSLLRLTGVPLALLRRVVSLETAVPLLASVVVSVAAGLGAAGLFLKAQLHQTLQAPTAQYFLFVSGGIVTSLAIVASTLPLLARITGPDTARNE
jgi:hypothetical protein